FRLPDGTAFGIIASTTTPFCRACDRSRLTADGTWYTCLYAPSGANIRAALRSGASDAEIASLLRVGWRARADRGAEQRLMVEQRGARAASPAAEDADSALALLLSAARGAQACGYGAEDTERLVSELAAQLGLADVQVSSLPTQLQLAIGIPGQQRLVLLRTTPMPVDLDRICRLDAVAREVKAGRIGPREASVRIDAIARSPLPYSGPVVLFGYCLAAAGAVLLFGEDLPEVLTAAVAGLAVGSIALVRTRVRELDLAAELLSALIAGFISQTVSARIWPLDPRVATLGAVVVLLPGFTLTQGVRELQTRNLLSGLAGLGAAAVTFLALVIGAVLGGGLGARLFGPARVPPVDLPDGIYLLGAAALGLAAVVV